MTADIDRRPELCNCLALRQAARHVTQFYDHCLAATGLRTTQFSILANLQRLGPIAINDLAAGLVMDRTTLGRSIQPLQRKRLVAVRQDRTDSRSKELILTNTGVARLRAAANAWAAAQAQFEAKFGREAAVDLRARLRAVTACDLGTTVADNQIPND